MLNKWWKVKSVFRSHYFVDARWSLNENGQPLYIDNILWTPSWVYVLVNNYVCKRCIDGGMAVLAKCMSLKSDPHLNIGQLTMLSSTLGILTKQYTMITVFDLTFITYSEMQVFFFVFFSVYTFFIQFITKQYIYIYVIYSQHRSMSLISV